MEKKTLNDLTLRNRKNQQNYRERQRQFRNDLKARLQLCESQRVEAMKQIQLAARRVDHENRILRSVLRDRFMLADDDIQQVLLDGVSTQISAAEHPGTPNVATTPGIVRDSVQTVSRPYSPAASESPSPTDLRQHSGCVPSDATMNRYSASNDSMSCQAASEILLSIQANTNAEEIRQELGCGQQDACLVRNTDVFQVLNAHL